MSSGGGGGGGGPVGDFNAAKQGGFGRGGDIRTKGYLLYPFDDAKKMGVWVCEVLGPAGTPYEGRVFTFFVTFRDGFNFSQDVNNKPRVHTYPGNASKNASEPELSAEHKATLAEKGRVYHAIPDASGLMCALVPPTAASKSLLSIPPLLVAMLRLNPANAEDLKRLMDGGNAAAVAVLKRDPAEYKQMARDGSKGAPLPSTSPPQVAGPWACVACTTRHEGENALRPTCMTCETKRPSAVAVQPAARPWACVACTTKHEGANALRPTCMTCGTQRPA